MRPWMRIQRDWSFRLGGTVPRPASSRSAFRNEGVGTESDSRRAVDHVNGSGAVHEGEEVGKGISIK